jgi:copper homeostasis protein
LGIDRILTSGQRPSATAGIDLITQLVKKAKDRIIIMPGVGIDETNIRDLVEKTGAKEYHVLAQKRLESPMTFRNQAVFMGSNPDLPEYETFLTDWERIDAICRKANE